MEENIFRPYLGTSRIFKASREILRSSYVPEKLLHRDSEIRQLAGILASALKGSRPSNILIFGKTGTGKTATVKYLESELKKAMGNQKNVEYIYINCQTVDTPYGVLQDIGNRIDQPEKIPFTGWSIDRVYSVLKEKLDEKSRVIIVVMDEVDRLVYKNGDEILYHLSRINDELKNTKLSIVGISNNLKFTEFLDPRVQSRLGEERVAFSPYTATQLKDILAQRASLAFEGEAIHPEVIELCAAFAAQEHGDARRALDLLRVAAEIAERNSDGKVLSNHVHKAKRQIELDCVTETIRTLPTHSKLVLLSVILGEEAGNNKLTTGDVYHGYTTICRRVGVAPLTQRRVADFISELDMLGIINARLKSFGRGGRTKEVQSSVPRLETKKLLEDDELLKCLNNFKMPTQTTLI